jgi:hypothetical protein
VPYASKTNAAIGDLIEVCIAGDIAFSHARAFAVGWRT